MTTTRTLLFLHGINDSDPAGKWLKALNHALLRDGREDIKSRGWTVLAPSYLDLLDGEAPVDVPPPVFSYRRSGDEAARRHAQGEYWKQLADLERTLNGTERPNPSDLWYAVSSTTIDLLIARVFAQAERYRLEHTRRHAIQARLLDALPSDGELIIVAHSLGSVVAADLLYHLPSRVHVRAVITLGSPLSHPLLRKHLSRLNDEFPFERTGPWLNVVGDSDVVTASRGVSHVFPEVSDVFVDNGGPAGAHDAVRYLEQEAVVRAINWADQAEGHIVGETPSLPDVPMNDALLALTVGAQYALRVEQSLDPGERRTRFATARGLVAAEVAAEWRLTGTDHPVLNRLLRDNAAILSKRLTRETALAYLLTAWLGNPVEPYRIEVDEQSKRRALTNLAMDLDLPASYANTVIEAAKLARSSHDEGFSWWKVSLVAAGLGAVLAAPALVLVAAPAGLVGGAALVAGLAGLGPGGMLGGLTMIGIVGGLGGSLAVGALAGGTSGQVQGLVTFLQARAKAAHDLRFDGHDHAEWRLLTAMASTVATAARRQLQTSDGGSATCKEIELKQKHLRRALEWMETHDLAPRALPATPQAIAELTSRAEAASNADTDETPLPIA